LRAEEESDEAPLFVNAGILDGSLSISSFGHAARALRRAGNGHSPLGQNSLDPILSCTAPRPAGWAAPLASGVRERSPR
jgi:hypothetical protein